MYSIYDYNWLLNMKSIYDKIVLKISGSEIRIHALKTK